MSALRILFGSWVLGSAAFIEFYARRYEYSGVPLLPHGVLAIAALAVLFLPRGSAARLGVPQGVGRFCTAGVVCAAALALAAQSSLQLVHVGIVAGLLAAVLAVLAPFLLRRPVIGPLARVATVIVLAVLTFLLILYYLVLVIGLETWNQVVSRELIWTYAWQLPELIAALPIGAWIPYAASVGVLLALLLAYWLGIPGIAGGIRAVGRELHAYFASPGRQRQRQRLSMLTACLAIASLLGHFVFQAVAYGTTPDPLVRTLLSEKALRGTTNMPMAVDRTLDSIAQEAAARYAAPERISAKTLVLITVDALRADQMHVYGHERENTPFLTRLHREGRLVRFDNAFAACTESHCGLLAILFGRNWHEIGPGRQRFGLTDVLKRLGYRNHFLLGGDHVNFYNLRKFYGDSIDEYADGASAGGYMNDDFEVIGWLRRLDPAGDAQRFVYLHLMSVHMLGKRHPQFRRWHRSQPGARGRYPDNYHAGILQSDALIEQAFQILGARGLLEDAIVVITSDHGELIGEGGKFGHGASPLDPVVRVPLLIYDTDAFGYPPHVLASVTDVAPTFLERIGAPIPDHWTGIPLSRPKPRRYVLTQGWDEFALIGEFGGDLYKYYRGFRGDTSERLVRLGSPGVERTIADGRGPPGVLHDLRAELDRRVPALRSGR